MRRLLIALLLPAVLVAFAGSAQARVSPALIQQSVAIPVFPVVSMTSPPPGFTVDGTRALAVAKTSPALLAIHRREHPLVYQVEYWIGSHYEVMFYFHGKVVADVMVSRTGQLGPTWTGPLIDGVFARGGYSPLFDSPWVCLTFGLMFLLPFLRRPSKLTLRHLDLVVLLSFGLSYYLFDNGHLVAAVWLVYPPLLYLLVRMLIVGRGRGGGRGAERSWLPLWALGAGLLALVGARIGLALAAPRVIDVGYASVMGAHRILHGASLYYATLGHPDTYGPVAYLAYVPFEALWPWHGTWDYLPAARAGAITFDVLTVLGLVLLGRRLRCGRSGWQLGLLLGWVWAAFPLTLLGVMAGTNDGLIALALVAVLLVLSSPLSRGALLGLATAAKFFPALLLGVLATGVEANGRRARITVAGFVIAAGGTVALFLPSGGLREFYDHTIGYQLSRSDVFSLWALHPTLGPVKVALEVAVVALALVLAFRPRGTRNVMQVSALMAAIVVAAQLPAIHWFYYYVMWFLPLVAVAVLAPTAAAPDLAAAGEVQALPAEPAPPPILVGSTT